MALSAIRQDERRARLLEVGMLLVLRDGFAATTVDAIAAGAGVGRRTFFRYFPTKHDLVFAWMGSFAVQLKSVARQHAHEGPLAALRAALDTVSAPMNEDRPRTLALLRAIEDDPVLSAQRQAKGAQWRTALAQGLASALPRERAAEATLLAGIGLAVYDDAVATWVRRGERRPFAALIDDRLATLGAIFDGSREKKGPSTRATASKKGRRR